jgi:signal transduction histidine kinase
MTAAYTQPLRVLVADDEAAVLSLYGRVLNPHRRSDPTAAKLDSMRAELFGARPDSDDASAIPPYDLTLCSQAEEAVDAARKACEQHAPFAMAFLDVRMPPGKDGIWAAEQIRKFDRDIQIVIATGFSDIRPAEIEKRVPPRDRLLYVQKPFHIHEIAQFASTLAARWQVEKALQDVHQQLDATIRLRTSELEQANEKLRQDIVAREQTEAQNRLLEQQLDRARRMESLAVLAGGVAHDLNNMLGPLVGYPELLLKQIPEDSKLRKPVERIGNAAKAAAEVVQDLLSLARRGRMEISPTDVNEVVRAYLDSPSYMQQSEKHSDVKVILNLHPDVARIGGSSPHLQKAVMNLIVNAFDAMPSGGELTISTTLLHLERLAGGYSVIPGEYIRLGVRDTGTGIAPEDIDKIFEPYFSRKKMGSSGSGLGLSVVYGIVKDHKGYYDVFSRLGEGTEFVLYLPLATDVPEMPATTAMETRGKETVLVIDDSPEQRQLIVEMLADLGYTVTAVSSGTEALRALNSEQSDLLVLDMILESNLDGLETYRQALTLRPGQRAIIISGYGVTDRVSQTQALGAGAFVKKPFSQDTLARAVRECLDGELSVAQT